jgi:hypothetical protein
MLIINEKSKGVTSKMPGAYVFNGDIYSVDDGIIIDIPGTLYVVGLISAHKDIIIRCNGLIAHSIRAYGNLISECNIEATVGGINVLQNVTVIGNIDASSDIVAVKGNLEATGYIETRGNIEAQCDIKSGAHIKACNVESSGSVRADAGMNITNNVIAACNVTMGACNVGGFINAGGYVLVVRGGIKCGVRAHTVISALV